MESQADLHDMKTKGQLPQSPSFHNGKNAREIIKIFQVIWFRHVEFDPQQEHVH